MGGGAAGVNGGGVVTMAPVGQGVMAMAMRRHAMAPARALVGHAVMARDTVVRGHGRSGVAPMVTGPVRRARHRRRPMTVMSPVRPARRRRLGVVMVAVDPGLNLASAKKY